MDCFEGCYHCSLERTKKSHIRDLQRKRNIRYYEKNKDKIKEKKSTLKEEEKVLRVKRKHTHSPSALRHHRGGYRKVKKEEEVLLVKKQDSGYVITFT